jgi:hypothetical protein
LPKRLRVLLATGGANMKTAVLVGVEGIAKEREPDKVWFWAGTFHVYMPWGQRTNWYVPENLAFRDKPAARKAGKDNFHRIAYKRYRNQRRGRVFESLFRDNRNEHAPLIVIEIGSTQ